jgi:hypothetical protein
VRGRGQRLDAAGDGILQSSGGIGLSQADGCLHRRQQILGTMLRFPGQHDDLSVAPLALGDVARCL